MVQDQQRSGAALVLGQRPAPRTTKQTGVTRAFITITLLTLDKQERCEIVDSIDGQAGRILLQKAGLTFPVTPDGMSYAIHKLKGWMIVSSDADAGRTYKIKISGGRRLTTQTREALELDREWAWKIAGNDRNPGRPANEKLPEIDLVEQLLELTATSDTTGPDGRRVTTFGAAEPHSQLNGSARTMVTTPSTPSTVPTPQTVRQSVATNMALSLPPTANEAALLRYVLRQAGMIRELKQRLGQSVDQEDELSGAVGELLKRLASPAR